MVHYPKERNPERILTRLRQTILVEHEEILLVSIFCLVIFKLTITYLTVLSKLGQDQSQVKMTLANSLKPSVLKMD